LHTEQNQFSLFFGGVESPTQFMWNQSSHSSHCIISQSFLASGNCRTLQLPGRESGYVWTALLKCRKWKSSVGETF